MGTRGERRKGRGGAGSVVRGSVGRSGMRGGLSGGVEGEGGVTVREGIGGGGGDGMCVVGIGNGSGGVESRGEIKGGVVTVVEEGLETPEAMASQEGGKLWSSMLRSVPGSKS